MDFVIIFWTVICVMALFLLLIDPGEAENGPKLFHNIRSRWERLNEMRDPNEKSTMSKDVVLAMAQRSVYKLDGSIHKDEPWARSLMATSCSKLDSYHPYTTQIEKHITNFTETLEKAMNECQEKICEFVELSRCVSDARTMLEEEIYRDQCVNGIKPTPDPKDKTIKDDKSCSTERGPIQSSDQCFDIKKQEDMLSVYDAFVEENLTRLTKNQNVDCQQQQTSVKKKVIIEVAD